MSRYVVIGAGVAGTRAAETIRAQQSTAEVVVLGAEPHPFYRRPQLVEYAAGRMSAQALSARDPSSWREQNLDVRLGVEVASVNPEAGAVVLADGSEVHYDQLIVATGRRAAARTPGSRPGSLAGVVAFTTLDEAGQVRALQGSGGRAVIFGDTLPALQMVQAASAVGLETTYLPSGERVMPEVLDEDASQIIAGRLRAAGVRLVWGASVEQVVDDGGHAAGVRLTGGQLYPADIVGACAGYEPAVAMLPVGAEGLHVADDLSTPWPGVWAAGDVVGDEPPFNWLRAWRQGERAGLAACGARLPVGPGRSPVHVLNSQLMGLSVVAIGQTVVPYRSGPTERRTDVMGEVYKKLVFAEDGRLVGALLVGNVAEAGALEEAVRMGVRKSDLNPSLVKQIFETTYQPLFVGVQCPVCRHEIQLEPGAKAGDRITCPVCGVDFQLEDGEHGLQVRAVC